MKPLITAVKYLVPAVLLAVFAAPAQAGVIVGGSTLINGAGLAQLEAWLGEGQLTLTNIFTKQAGDSSLDFHAAADGKGRTISVMFATDDNVSAIIGGYNPQSWNSGGGYNITSVYDAFIFNLTNGELRMQSDAGAGVYQTYNLGSYGPTFGGGHDLTVGANSSANSSLGYGYSYGYSYGVAGDSQKSIVSGQFYDGGNMEIGALEVFTISGFTPDTGAISVPEPASLALLGIGLAGLGAMRRKQRA